MRIDEFTKMFIESDETHFPVEGCVILDEREKQVFHHGNKFLCLVVDSTHGGNYEVRLLTPYIWKDDKKILFGWNDSYGNVIDNLYNCIHMDDCVVVGFMPCESTDDEIKEYTTKVREKIDSQWE